MVSSPPPDRPANHVRKRFAKVNALIDCTMHGLTRAELAVWLVLWRDTKTDGLARTGQADIARRVGVSVRAVHTAVRGLKSKGLLQVLSVGRLGCGPSVYRVRGVCPDPA